MQIARLSEVPQPLMAERIQLISEQALMLIDGFIRSTDQIELPLEPTSTAAVLYDVAHVLQPLAAVSNYEIHVDLPSSNRPIMVHRETLKTMLTILSTSFIEGRGEENLHHLVLASHRTAKGVVVGAFTDDIQVSQQAVRLSRQLHGRASQSFPELGLVGGAGLAIADRLSSRLNAPLKACHHRSLAGIGSLFAPSQQLSLVM